MLRLHLNDIDSMSTIIAMHIATVIDTLCMVPNDPKDRSFEAEQRFLTLNLPHLENLSNTNF